MFFSMFSKVAAICGWVVKGMHGSYTANGLHMRVHMGLDLDNGQPRLARPLGLLLMPKGWYLLELQASNLFSIFFFLKKNENK